MVQFACVPSAGHHHHEVEPITWLFRCQGRDLTELRQAENKVKMSDPILHRDIDILEQYGSGLL